MFMNRCLTLICISTLLGCAQEPTSSNKQSDTQTVASALLNEPNVSAQTTSKTHNHILVGPEGGQVVLIPTETDVVHKVVLEIPPNALSAPTRRAARTR